jgi:PAS domain S-box-containing protein
MKKKSGEFHKNKIGSQDTTNTDKRAEESQLENAEKYKNILKNIHDGFFELDLAGNFTFFNDSACHILGYSRKELMGMNYRHYTDKENAKKVYEAYFEVYNTGEPSKRFGWQVTRKDGAKRYIETSVSLEKDSSGKPIGFIGIVNDVTDRKQAEKELKKSKTLLESVFNSTQDLILVVDRELRVLLSNWKSPLYAGCTEFPINSHCYEAFINRETPCEPCHALGVFNTGKPIITEYYNQHTKLFKEVSAYPIFDDNNNVIMVAEHVRDITDRKRAEEELTRVNRALLILSDTNQAMVHIMDEATLLNEVSRIIVEVGGYHMAWVGFAENDEAKTILPVAHAGFDSGYIESVNVTWADNERGRGPGGIAIRTGKPSIARNIPQDPAFTPWREAAIERGYKSNIALPLISAGQTFGELSIYSADSDAFDSREVEILQELADDLAFGITSLRMRVKKDQAEVALSESEERYRLIAENTADAINVFDLNLNKTYVSPSILKLRGYTVQEAMTQPLDQMLTPDSLEWARKVFAEQMALESSGTADPARTALMELEEYCKDGSTIWVEVALSFLRDNNLKPTGILTLTRNITERKKVEMELQKTLESLTKAFGATVQVMVSAVEMRDPYTAGHQLRVADLACAIATEMELSQEKIEGVRMAGSIHDIGKLSVPAEILVKPTKLTNNEFSIIKEHSQTGYDLLKGVESSWPLAQIVYQHHERMDGSGYPRNLKGDEILMEARIMAVADVVEAMASHRPYRPSLGIDAALAEIEKNKGIFYDDAVADACLRLFREKGYQLK